MKPAILPGLLQFLRSTIYDLPTFLNRLDKKTKLEIYSNQVLHLSLSKSSNPPEVTVREHRSESKGEQRVQRFETTQRSSSKHEQRPGPAAIVTRVSGLSRIVRDFDEQVMK